jgi:hypothetical protein
MKHQQMSRPLRNASIGVFTITSFMGACLLFLVQPMFAKLILPRLGGSPAVWNTCVLFFQTTLLLGYLYAHITTKWLGVRRQAMWHLVVVLAPAIFLPLSLGPSDPTAAERPVSWLLTTMAWTVGVPFFVVSTSAPLLQRWFGALPIAWARDPYFLYAASNLGSMIALLGYPFVFEPSVGLQDQTVLWAAGYAIFVVMIGGCVWLVRTMAPVREIAAVEQTPDVRIPPPDARTRLQWIGLAFIPSSLMLGVTTYISTDIAAMPLLWVLPLALYLLTFVLAFSRRQIVTVRSLDIAMPILILASLAAILAKALWLLPVHLVTFFCVSLACHTRLADRRPDVLHLTEFYLWLSFGGMLGGVFNSLVAPNVFSTIVEYPLVLAIASALHRSSPLRRDRAIPVAVLTIGFLIVSALLAIWAFGLTSADVGRTLLAIAIGLSTLLIVNRWGWAGQFRVFTFALLGVTVYAELGTTSRRTVLFVGRSFFGVHRVLEAPDHTYRLLQHGNTVHGWQHLSPDDRCEPGGYYSVTGPIGQLFTTGGSRFADVGVVGLGAGGLACYADKQQRWTFYEIDPLVEQLAKNPAYFTHLRNSGGEVDVVLGDGRITLNTAEPSQYDLIILDAFSSDAIPVHLLTREAFQLYLSKLKPTGIIAMNISNRYVKVEPVIAAMAQAEGLHALVNEDLRVSAEEREKGRFASSWVLLARDRNALVALEQRPGWRLAIVDPAIASWSDDYSNILQVLRFN